MMVSLWHTHVCRVIAAVFVCCRPHQHSASWWPRLFADDAADVAWDDAPKDYTDLPPAIAAAAAAGAEREDDIKRKQAERREAKQKLQVWQSRMGKGEVLVVGMENGPAAAAAQEGAGGGERKAGGAARTWC